MKALICAFSLKGCHRILKVLKGNLLLLMWLLFCYLIIVTFKNNLLNDGYAIIGQSFHSGLGRFEEKSKKKKRLGFVESISRTF